ncbi:hypothetical protein KR093_005678 [Drosophila rubida]|uniref:BPTI/Kunitz inhibitor domain-containing protein n=1 Tax=Drosophila rubida TaxID=30044 RepID=A0AAD4PLA1_9MUSC|nr:hypothetical protein KR093_005678 [Drosophila rubida]
MKFLLILGCLALYVAQIEAQRCLGLPLTQNCRNGRNSGYTGSDCRANANFNMWYYDRSSESCKSMSYLGCGGNNNRYCTKASCDRNCPRGTRN